jgi:hypothetical protein
VTTTLLANPGATRDEIISITGLSAPTVTYALERLAVAEPHTWPRQWKLRVGLPIIEERPEEKPVASIPVEQGWAQWARACMSWPNAIGRLSMSTDPRELAAGLAAMSASAAALSNVFMQVSDEPDWLERIGGGQ